MKSLIKISFFGFVLCLIWAWAEWKSAVIEEVDWQQITAYSNIPNNAQIKMPEGFGVHPLAFSSKTKDGKVDSYRYLYVPEKESAQWIQAVEALKNGDQAPLQSLVAKTKSVVIVDTLRYTNQALDATPQTVEAESEVVGYCHRGSNYLKANKAEFKQLFPEVDDSQWIVLVENPGIERKPAFPVVPVSATVVLLFLTIGLSVARSRSES